MENVCNQYEWQRGSTCSLTLPLVRFLHSSRNAWMLSDESRLVHCNNQHFCYTCIRHWLWDSQVFIGLMFSGQHEMCLHRRENLKCIYERCLANSSLHSFTNTLVSLDLFFWWCNSRIHMVGIMLMRKNNIAGENLKIRVWVTQHILHCQISHK